MPTVTVHKCNIAALAEFLRIKLGFSVAVKYYIKLQNILKRDSY